MSIHDLIFYCLKGNRDAVQWFMTLRDVLHLWDDLIDGDKPLSNAAIHAGMFSALVTLPNNSFFNEHRQALSPVLVNAIGNWHAANAFEGSGDDRLLNLAYVVRSDYANLLIQAAYLVGGYAWMTEVTPAIRGAWTGETLQAYKSNLQRECAAREGNSAELVKQWYEQETSEYLAHGLTVFNAAMLADTEQGHVDALAEMIGMEAGQVVIDMGCGVGGVSRLMRNLYPTATFYGVTNVLAQAKAIEQSTGVIPVLSDYHRTPIDDGFADVVMFNESIGYGDLDTLLNEAFRLLKPGGVLAIKDGVSLTGRDEWSSEWQWFTFAKGRIDEVATKIGFTVELSQSHEYDLTRYQEFIKNSPLMNSRYKAENVCKGEKLSSWFWRLRKPEGEKNVL